MTEELRVKNHTRVLCSAVIFLHWLNTHTPYTRCTCKWYTTTTAITQTTSGSTRKSNHVLRVGPSFDLQHGSGGERRRKKKQTVGLPSERAFLSTGSRRTSRTKLISFVGFFSQNLNFPWQSILVAEIRPFITNTTLCFIKNLTSTRTCYILFETVESVSIKLKRNSGQNNAIKSC